MFLPPAIATTCEGREGYFSLATIACGAFEFCGVGTEFLCPNWAERTLSATT